MVDTYSLRCCVVVVVAATDAPGVPADEAAAVRAALAYVLGSFGLVGGCVCAWVLPGEAVKDGLGKDLALGAVDVRGAQLVLAMLYLSCFCITHCVFIQ